MPAPDPAPDWPPERKRAARRRAVQGARWPRPFVAPVAGGRGSLADEYLDCDAQGFGNEDKVGEPGISFAALVALDAAAFEADAVSKLVLGKAGGAPELHDAAAEEPAALEDVLG